MSAQDVVEVLRALEAADVSAIVDGGWGVDALVGFQSREHDDLDLVVGWPDIDASVGALSELGFSIVKDERPCSFVMGDSSDRRVDIHPVEWDPEGGGFQAQPDGKPPWRYSPEGLAGTGSIGGFPVRCLSPEEQVRCHDGYELDEGDLADLRLLRNHLGAQLLQE